LGRNKNLWRYLWEDSTRIEIDGKIIEAATGVSFTDFASHTATTNAHQVSFDNLTATAHTHLKSDISNFTESDYVHTTGVESIAGDKTFQDDIIIQGDVWISGSATTTTVRKFKYNR